jgi:hypothetical protein
VDRRRSQRSCLADPGVVRLLACGHGLEEVVELDAVEMDARRFLQVVREDGPDLVALVDADRRPWQLLVVAQRGDGRDDLVDLVGGDLVDREPEDLDAAVDLRGQRLEQVAQDQLRPDGHEGGLLAEFRVAVGGAQDLPELGKRRQSVDALEGRHKIAEVAAHDGPRRDVVLAPAGREGRPG